MEYQANLLTVNYSLKDFCVDRHLPDMLVFHQKTDFHAHTLYMNGSIILQVWEKRNEGKDKFVELMDVGLL